MDNIFIIVGAIIIPVLYGIIYFKKRRLRHRPDVDTTTPVEGTDADRARAEADLHSHSQLKDLEELLQTHRLYDRYTTHQGFDEAYMDDFTQELARSGVNARAIFQETMPLGVAHATLIRQGVYELYILSEDFDRADQIVRARLARR